MRRRLSGMIVVGLGLSLSSGALAQPRGADVQARGADTEKQGKAKFDAGREALRAGRVKEALALFQESWGFNEIPGTMLNIARCEETLGLPASAWRHYKEALALLPPKDDRVPAVQELVATLEPHVPVLRVRLDKGAPAGTKVTLAGKPMVTGTLDTELPMDPGKVTIAVSAPGHVLRTYDVVLEDGKKETVVVSPGAPEVELERPSVVVPPGAEEPVARPFPWRTAAMAGGGTLAVFGAGIGIAGLVLAGEKAGERDAICTGGGCPRPGMPGYAEQKASWLKVEDERVFLGNMGITAVLVGGLALAATGAVWLFWKPVPLKAGVAGGVGLVAMGNGAAVRGTW